MSGKEPPVFWSVLQILRIKKLHHKNDADRISALNMVVLLLILRQEKPFLCRSPGSWLAVLIFLPGFPVDGSRRDNDLPNTVAGPRRTSTCFPLSSLPALWQVGEHKTRLFYKVYPSPRVFVNNLKSYGLKQIVRKIFRKSNILYQFIFFWG